VVRSFDWLDVIRVVVGSSVFGVAVHQLSKGLRETWSERSRRKTLLAVMDKLIALEPDQTERLQARLEWVRPPPPDQIGPPAPG
jgi:hypothetical protein